MRVRSCFGVSVQGVPATEMLAVDIVALKMQLMHREHSHISSRARDKCRHPWPCRVDVDSGDCISW
jgi:hypothetical protein